MIHQDNDRRILQEMRPWPNKMGWTYRNWDIMQNSNHEYVVSFTPPGECYATKCGVNKYISLAILKAKKID